MSPGCVADDPGRPASFRREYFRRCLATGPRRCSASPGSTGLRGTSLAWSGEAGGSRSSSSRASAPIRQRGVVEPGEVGRLVAGVHGLSPGAVAAVASRRRLGRLAIVDGGTRDLRSRTGQVGTRKIGDTPYLCQYRRSLCQCVENVRTATLEDYGISGANLTGP